MNLRRISANHAHTEHFTAGLGSGINQGGCPRMLRFGGIVGLSEFSKWLDLRRGRRCKWSRR